MGVFYAFLRFYAFRFHSKKCCFFEKRFQQGKKFGGAGASISCAAFENEGHFCRHFVSTVILSFANIIIWGK